MRERTAETLLIVKKRMETRLARRGFQRVKRFGCGYCLPSPPDRWMPGGGLRARDAVDLLEKIPGMVERHPTGMRPGLRGADRAFAEEVWLSQEGVELVTFAEDFACSQRLEALSVLRRLVRDLARETG